MHNRLSICNYNKRIIALCIFIIANMHNYNKKFSDLKKIKKLKLALSQFNQII